MKKNNLSKVPNSKVNIICDKDQIRHKATDFTITEDVPVKTAAPEYKDFYQKKHATNLQKHSGNIEHPKGGRHNLSKSTCFTRYL